jgi:hypothetical protein
VEYNGSEVSNLSIAANTPIALQIVNADAAGDPIPVQGTTPLTVNLTTTEAIGEFESTSGGGPITSTTIPVGAASVTVYFESSNAETISAPANLSASAASVAAPVVTAVETSGGINLTWPAVSGAVTYSVMQSVNNGAYAAVATNLSSSTTSYEATGLTAGGSYTYEVTVQGNTTTATGTSNAVEYGANATGVTASGFSAATASAAGSVTLTVAYNKALDTTSADQTFSDYTVEDTTASKALTVTEASVNGDDLVLTVSIPAGDTTVAATDTVTVNTSKSVVNDSYGNPTANVSETGTL